MNEFLNEKKRNDKIQIIVISGCEERKKDVIQQFNDIELSQDFDIHFIDAITPKNSSIQLKPVHKRVPEKPGTLCCFLSHTKAMDWYITNSKLPYLLLLEDDCAIVKSGFKTKLLSLIDSFSFNEFDYISLGYHPTSIQIEYFKNPLTKRSNNVYWNLYKIRGYCLWGTQAQLFPRTTVESLVNIYKKQSFDETWKSISSYLLTNPEYNFNDIRIQIDALNSLIKHQALVFPPLVIEMRNNKSLISNTSDNLLWKRGEEKGLYSLTDFYSWDTSTDFEILVYSVSDERRAPMRKQLEDLKINSRIQFIDGITPKSAPFELLSQDGLYPEDAPTISCLLSFIKALEHFVTTSRSKYVIIMEDDAALLKSGFEDTVRNAISIYESNTKDIDYISLGYNVGSISPDEIKSDQISHVDNVFWNIYKLIIKTDKGLMTKNIWGTQAQLFSREKAAQLYSILGGKKSTKEIYDSINSHVERYGKINRNRVRLQLDAIIPCVMKQAIVYPPIVIERSDIPSLIMTNHSHTNTWKMGETQGIYNLANFYSY